MPIRRDAKGPPHRSELAEVIEFVRGILTRISSRPNKLGPQELAEKGELSSLRAATPSKT